MSTLFLLLSLFFFFFFLNCLQRGGATAGAWASGAVLGACAAAGVPLLLPDNNFCGPVSRQHAVVTPLR